MDQEKRATLDIDLFIRPNLQNAKRTIKALEEFGYDLMDLSPEDFLEYEIFFLY